METDDEEDVDARNLYLENFGADKLKTLHDLLEVDTEEEVESESDEEDSEETKKQSKIFALFFDLLNSYRE